ncbi:hypothetical protein F9K33_09655 [bacterium]|nr:MAG: hypothetical protein F9K33_09655 [bacterium]
MKPTKEQMANSMPTIFAVLMIAMCRLLPHPWNFVPVSATAIFGGIYLNKKWAFILPIASMAIADIFLGFSLFDMPFVYGSILLAVLIGIWIGTRRKNKAAFTASLVSGTLGSSLIFYIVTNFGSWLTLGLYTKDLSGLIQSYVMALPFFRNSLAGDMFFVSIFVISYELISWFVSRSLKKSAVIVAK